MSTFRRFTRHSEAWYFDVLKDDGTVDVVSMKVGSRTGARFSMAITWTTTGFSRSPFDPAWLASDDLADLREWWDAMVTRDVTPVGVCADLLALGFVDETTRERPT